MILLEANYVEICKELIKDSQNTSAIIAGVFSIVVAALSGIVSYRLAIKKNKHDKNTQLSLEIDKMQAEAFCQLHKPLRYIAKNNHCPYAMFGTKQTSTNKETVLYRTKADEFITEINGFLFGPRGSLFLPRELRNSLFEIRGIVSDILYDEKDKTEIVLNSEKTINNINLLISGDKNIHKQLRILMGTEDRKPVNNI